jgi:two-component system response regulator (stage 0 sporulation protein F)
VILLDVKMPGMNGMETLNEIRKIDRNVPVVMMTAYGELEIMEEAQNKGVKHQISKPFDLNELRALVKGILETGLRESALQLG